MSPRETQMRARLAAAIVLSVLTATVALLAPSASAESSPSAFGTRLVSLINQARSQHGLRALTVAAGTSTVASNWTSHLDAQQALSHNPDLGHQLETHGSPNWTAYGENVGDGPTSSADTLFQAYMNSPEHRDNILGSAYRYVGVGVVFDGSTAWNTLDFVDQYSGSSTSTTSTTSTSTTSHPRATTTPKTTTTKTTAAPRTTTPKPAVVHHVVARTVTPARPKPAHRVQVRAVASKAAAPAAAPIALPALPAPAAERVVAAVPVSNNLPAAPRNSAVILLAAAAILLVVASRYVAEVIPARRVTAA